MTESTLSISNLDDLKITPIRLDEASVKGLNSITVQQMKDVASKVNQYMELSGQATRASMVLLYKLKSNVGQGNWTAFINSNVLSVSAKVAADYVNAYEKWLKSDEDVTDGVIGSLSARALVAIANCESSLRTVIKGKILAGATSENDIRKLIADASGKSSKAKDKTTEKRVDEIKVKIRELYEEFADSTNLKTSKEAMGKMKAMNLELASSNNQFRSENKSLNERMDSLKENNKKEVDALRAKIDQLQKDLEFAKAG